LDLLIDVWRAALSPSSHQHTSKLLTNSLAGRQVQAQISVLTDNSRMGSPESPAKARPDQQFPKAQGWIPLKKADRDRPKAFVHRDYSRAFTHKLQVYAPDRHCAISLKSYLAA
jgi:hypothetical protein